MPTQEVARAARPSALLQCGERRRHSVLLDGGGPDSWGCGDVLYADEPAATLEVMPSGWARWRVGGAETWRWGDPLAQWEAFLAAGRADLGDAASGAGFLTVLGYDLKHWIEALPRRLPLAAPAGAVLRPLRLVLPRQLPHRSRPHRRRARRHPR